ncbi:MAG: hypothetical protein P0Y65_17090 [Candidatus Devosia phytovorans]|uniref:ApeA N-terminal domain-containing protein n=1 Tax=Candidatus Devosia phytovorans TaxID=3121372 RepID=A0AAJ5VUM3_9HYPH|nr:hypothetical protein [Devosia sp.]WEK03887.1 MAG: hypothetical protein P0Y65_17090 [Devosia sp.]
MWIYVPVKADDPDGEAPEAWVGKIENSGLPKGAWKFEAVRHSEFAGVYNGDPFTDASTVVGLLDHQRQCTLVRPFLARTDPGSIGSGLYARTIVSGEFQALVTGLQFPDSTDGVIDRLSFDSPSFAAWYGTAAFKKDYDLEVRKPSMEILDTLRESVSLSTGETVEVALGAEVSSRGSSASVRTASSFLMKFGTPANLDHVIEVAGELEVLFGFLIGFRRKPPTFQISVADNTATIDLAGWNWTAQELPDHFRPLHVRGLGGGNLKAVLSRFMSDRLSLVTRVHAVEFSRFFSNNLNDRFSMVMPVLEEYLLNRYKTGDEQSYLDLRQEFFDWIEASPNKNLAEFSRKHVKVVEQKAPGLATLIERAIDDVNRSNFAFPRLLAKRIQNRRGKVFHSAPSMTADEARKFYAEVRAATGLLLLLTLKDLGIDIATLSDRYFALWDLQGFFRPQDSAETAEPSAVEQE